MMEDLEDCNINSLLNISNHYSVLPYKYTLSKTGLNISTKEVSNKMQLLYIIYDETFKIILINTIILIFNNISQMIKSYFKKQ